MRDTWGDPGSQMPIRVPIYSFKQVPAGHVLRSRLYLAKRCYQLRDVTDLNKLFLEVF